MKLFAKLERRFARYAIPNLMLWFTVLYGIGFMIGLMNIRIYYEYLALDPGKVLSGQIWRLVTWIVYPAGGGGFLGVIALWVYYSLGTTLERTWGSFRFNFFMFAGVIFHIAASFLLYYVFGLRGYGAYLTPGNLNLSIFLAFAITYPDVRFYLYFVLPVKAKYMAVLYAVIEIYTFIVGSVAQKVTIFLCLFNVLLAWYLFGSLKRFTPQEVLRRQRFKSAVKSGQAGTAERRSAGTGESGKVVPLSRADDRNAGKTARHRCAVCGRTEFDGDDLEFRFCSKCKGEYEYCMDHLYTHKHVE